MSNNAGKDNGLLMPMATAVWLIENTALSFRQIADFTGLTEIEVDSLANGEIAKGLVGRDPIAHGELSREEIERCQTDKTGTACLKMLRSELPTVKPRARGPRYTPVSKRGDKPDAIAYILKNNPEISVAQICKLIGTTKPTIDSVRERTHPNMPNLRPRHPAELGLCTYQEFENASVKGLKAAGKDPEAVKAQRLAEQQQRLAPQEEETSGRGMMAGFDFSNFLKGSSGGTT